MHNFLSICWSGQLQISYRKQEIANNQGLLAISCIRNSHRDIQGNPQGGVSGWCGQKGKARPQEQILNPA